MPAANIPAVDPGAPQTAERWKWWAIFATSGGFGVLLSYILVNSVVKDTREMQEFLRTQFISELKTTSQNNALAAKAMEDAADAMEEQARTGRDTTVALKELTVANDRVAETSERLTESIDDLLKERLKENNDAPNRPVANPQLRPGP